MMGVPHKLRLLLLVLVAGALLWLNLGSGPNTDVVEPAPRALRSPQSAVPPLPGGAASADAGAVAAARPALELAALDPFAPAVRAPAVLPVAPPPPPVVAAPPAPPQAPAHNLVFVGRSINPQGNEDVYVQTGDAVGVARAGAVLPSGYRIESVTSRAIELYYPPLERRVRIDLPPAPHFETR